MPEEGLTFYHGRGCDHCRHTGYRGRIPFIELLANSPAIDDTILRRASLAELTEIAVAEGMTTLFAAGDPFGTGFLHRLLFR